MASRCLRAALAYAKRGWAVFPLQGKRPYPGTHGHRDATTDAAQIRAWWDRWPDANVGVACSSVSGPLVIDVDGPEGEKTVRRITLPKTWEATSGRPHRRHLYFGPSKIGATIKRMIHLRPELDVLGDGGYVVAPPSIHPKTGQPYRWLSQEKLCSFPKSLRLLIEHAKRSTSAAKPLPPIIGEGTRDDLLTSLAGSMRRRGASPEAILAALREENATKCDPPLDDKQLIKIARSIGTKTPAVLEGTLDDFGNARRFIAQNQEQIRHVRAFRNSWLVWDEQRWAGDQTGEAERLAKQTIRLLRHEAEQQPDPDLRDDLLKHAHRSATAGRMHALLDLASTEPEIALEPTTFDRSPWLFNVGNGTIDLKTGKLKPHHRDDLLTKLAPVTFDPKARAPRWEQFLRETMNDDPELIEFLQRAVGYSLTGDTREQCLFFCYGKGANGKSTFLEVIRALLGDYAQQSDFNTFLTKRSDGPRNDLARMLGSRLVTASEASGDRGFDETVLKQLTGGDTVVARRLYEEYFEFTPVHKLWLAANHKPIVREQTEAFWRRIRLVPFIVTFPKERWEKKLGERLQRTELSGILNWALAGCREWQAHGLLEPAVIRKATRSYREENDVLGEFFTARCELQEKYVSTNTELYRAFTEWWMDTRGTRSQPISPAWFGRLMGERAELRSAKIDGIRVWKGIQLRLGGPTS